MWEQKTNRRVESSVSPLTDVAGPLNIAQLHFELSEGHNFPHEFSIMARTLCIPATLLLLAALVLSLLVSISLPSLRSLDIARITFADGSDLTGIKTLSVLRVSVADCLPDSHSNNHSFPSISISWASGKRINFR
jgi:hypothetical protein